MVFLKDGQAVSGILVESTSTRLVLRIAGIETRFPAATVDRYRVLAPVLERYEEMRRAAGADADQLVRLAEWLRDRDRYELALLEAERAVAIDANNTEARRLALTLYQQVELKRKARAAQSRREDPAQPPRAQPPSPSRQRDFPLLSDAQVNLIKVYEVNMARPPRLSIKRDTITRLLERYAGHPLIPATQEGREAIYRKPEREILELMFRLQARDLYGEVKVLDQPDSMRIFRDEVQAKWLVNTCATSNCHGGEEAGRLMLCNRRANGEPAAYTNFLILDRFRLADGTPLINYDQPERSALLQLGLPREDSLVKHPAVPRMNPGSKVERDAFRPAFRSTDDRAYQQAELWIRSMYRPHPEYPLAFNPPGESVAAAPGNPAAGTADKPEPAPR